LLLVAIFCGILAVVGPVIAHHLPRGWFQLLSYAQAVAMGAMAVVFFHQWKKAK
jgi:hypothetical protein